MLIGVVADCYLAGVLTRRLDNSSRPGHRGIDKSQVTALAESLDEIEEAFRSRPLDAGPYTGLWIDALVVKRARAARIVKRAP